MLDHGDRRLHILLQSQHLQPACLPRLAKDTALHHVERMQLDPLHPRLHDAMQGIQTVHRHLAGQADDKVGTHLDPPLMGPCNRIDIGSIAVPPIDALQGLVVGALQSQLQPDFVTAGLIACQQIQHCIRHAVGPGTDA